MRHETRIALTAAVAGLPAVAVAIFALWVGDYATDVRITLTLLLLICWIGVATAVRNKVAYPLQAIANVLAALREGDFSLRARGTGGDDALNDVISEVNTLGATLQEQRLGVIETEALLRNVMREIEVAVFAFDERDNLRLVNHAGERLLAVPEEKLVGRDAEELGLEACLTGETVRQLTPSPVQSPAPPPTQSSVQLIDAAFPGGTGRWEVRRTTFRQSGRAHRLLVLSDLTKTLREEERQAWRRLIRVLGHELNNSLAPIKSLAGSMETLLDKQPRRSDWEDDMRRGLSVIQNRSESLSRFMEGYSRLAHLPSPTPRPVDVGEWIRRVVRLETRIAATVAPGPALQIQADADQLDQLLINLLRNAADAALEKSSGGASGAEGREGGCVRVGWGRAKAFEAASEECLEVWVDDDGQGLASDANLFVPFFTTKPNGSGIGLVLSRQIAEAHHGSLSLGNRPGAQGCRAFLRLPL